MFGTFKPECEKGLSFRLNVPSIVAYTMPGENCKEYDIGSGWRAWAVEAMLGAMLD